MFGRTNAKLTSATFALALLACLGPAAATDMDEAVAAERAKWQAIGHLQGPGYRMKRGCSGTLVAPEVVVTAAHCLTGAIGQPRKQVFRAGLYKGKASVARTYSEMRLHPLYSLSKGNRRLPYDIAVIRLAEPVDASIVAPLQMLTSNTPSPRRATLLGYRHDRPGALSIGEDCRGVLPPGSGMFLFDCEVVSGTSGGAVVVDTAEGPRLAAVIVARHGTDGNALAVPINAWVRETVNQMRQAQGTSP